MPKRSFEWNPTDPLARSGGETLNAWAALNDYARMGSGRSLPSLHVAYKKRTASAPAKSLTTLKNWSRLNAWQERVEAFDIAEQERQQTKFEDWNDAEIKRRQDMVERAHLLLPDLFTNVDTDRVPARDIAAFIRALSEVSRQVSGDDVQRVELAGPGGGAIRTKDETDIEARAARVLEMFHAARSARVAEAGDASDD